MKRQNRKRRASEFQRAYGSKARVAFVRSLPCVAALSVRWPCFPGAENAHVGTGGRGRKADAARIVPLCPNHHRELHNLGRDEFERRRILNLDWHAAETERAWQIHQKAGAEWRSQ